jgi:eukaryotic-like serine/threonine-protein kinase
VVPILPVQPQVAAVMPPVAAPVPSSPSATPPAQRVVIQAVPVATPSPPVAKVQTPRAAVPQPSHKKILNSRGRRSFLKWLSFGGVGVVNVVALSQLVKNSSTSETDAKPQLTKIQFTSVKLDRFGKIVDQPAGQAEIFAEDIGNGISLTMVKIPAGKFRMGSPASEEKQSQETVLEFFLGQTLVTQAQWQAVMGNNPSQFKGDGLLPVDSVNWLDAMDFCQKLSQKTGRTYRLPSEAEWEYACRAGTTTPFAFGETITAAVVNYNGNFPYARAARGVDRKKITPVGIFPANGFGLYDMHGNLKEWCLDEWDNNYYNASVDGSAKGDINSRDSGKSRLLRGGSWDSNAESCQSANRGSITASDRNNNVGLRVVAVSASTPSRQSF